MYSVNTLLWLLPSIAPKTSLYVNSCTHVLLMKDRSGNLNSGTRARNSRVSFLTLMLILSELG